MKDQIADLMKDSYELNFEFVLEGNENELFQFLREAKKNGIRAVVLKCKNYGTGAIAKLANIHADGALAIGGISMDQNICGFNSSIVAVEAGLGSKVVWMPTYSALNDIIHKIREEDMETYTLSPIDRDGNLLPEVKDILNLIRENNMVLATGHISRNEIFILVKNAIEMGIHRILINRALSGSIGTRLSFKDQIELTAMGAFMEYNWLDTVEPNNPITHVEFLEAIRTVGAENCILSSGCTVGSHPALGFYTMLENLLKTGVTEDEIEKMIKHNPQFLLDM